MSGRLSELKTTIDVGLLHRENMLQSIGSQLEFWNTMVNLNISSIFCSSIFMINLWLSDQFAGSFHCSGEEGKIHLPCAEYAQH